MLGVRDRELMSLELRLEGRPCLSMSHREREVVPDTGINERKGVLSFLHIFRIRNVLLLAEERRVRTGMYKSRRS